MKKNDVELIPTFTTWNAGFIMEKECYESLKKQIIYKLIEVKDEISGICFALHGSGTVEKIGDLKADLLRSMREIVEYEMPITVTLDLHTNMSEEMMKETQLYVGCI
ncbi:M81 family metallopeptidase [Romboutsia sp.]|uniref:M81 family metallopeptidase n=1 Tax=Romboutsia sp. TaxID=1965302 RepID=UPI002CD0616A|nr:M81 family metallopeptidase [Romboutsia sp.]HSQ89893.1 M81 family metallopeptidase [Romboutsia sp.]